MDKIDFVIIWVDGNDPQWINEKNKYSLRDDESTAVNRFRDWNNLQYWFRGVETFAPWVNKIHFVTYGHLPEWLDESHPKLNIVKHTDYIPSNCLPTFSSHPIELNLHRIEGLSEKFVYFNDDMFIIKNVEISDFFVDGLPCDGARMCLLPTVPRSLFHNILYNDICMLNSKFQKDEVIKANFLKYVNFRYGLKPSIRNLLFTLLDKKEFPSFLYDHLPAPYLKSTFIDVWDNFEEDLIKTSLNKFRNIEDINQYIFRYWQFASGNFKPIDMRKFGKGFSLPQDLVNVTRAIEQQQHKMICINDNDDNIDFEAAIKLINGSFDKILPRKSAYEK